MTEAGTGAGAAENGAGIGGAAVADKTLDAAVEGKAGAGAQEKGGIKTEAAVPWCVHPCFPLLPPVPCLMLSASGKLSMY